MRKPYPFYAVSLVLKWVMVWVMKASETRPHTYLSFKGPIPKIFEHKYILKVRCCPWPPRLFSHPFDSIAPTSSEQKQTEQQFLLFEEIHFGNMCNSRSLLRNTEIYEWSFSLQWRMLDWLCSQKGKDVFNIQLQFVITRFQTFLNVIHTNTNILMTNMKILALKIQSSGQRKTS